MRRIVYVAICYIATLGFASGATFSGPAKGKVNKINTVKVTQSDDDFKITVLFNGQPADADDYTIIENKAGQQSVLIMTDKTGVFTLVGADNKAGKTTLVTHTITIGDPGPQPAPTPPAPTPESDIATKIKAAWAAKKDPVALPKLVSILDEANSGTYRNFDEMEQVLSAAGKKYLPNDELRPIRDLISGYIVTKVGTDPRIMDVDKVKAVYSELLPILKTLN